MLCLDGRKVVWAHVAIEMKLMLLKDIGRDPCLWVSIPCGLLKDLGPKGVQTLGKMTSQMPKDNARIWKRGEDIILGRMGFAQNNVSRFQRPFKLVFLKEVFSVA